MQFQFLDAETFDTILFESKPSHFHTGFSFMGDGKQWMVTGMSVDFDIDLVTVYILKTKDH